MTNSWVSEERLAHYRPLIIKYTETHPFPSELNKYASGWKDSGWMLGCSLEVGISVDYLRKILIGMEWLSPKRTKNVATSLHIPTIVIAEANDNVLVLEHGRGGFKVIRAYGSDSGNLESNRLAAQSFLAGYEYAMRNNSKLLA